MKIYKVIDGVYVGDIRAAQDINILIKKVVFVKI